MLQKLFAWFRPKYVAKRCGHTTKLKGTVSAFGEEVTTKMPQNEDSSVDWCLDCLGKMAIKCAWCPNVIFIGDPVTLYTPTTKDFKLPEGAVVYKTDPLQVVGCLGWDCADTGADRAGFWLPGDDGKGRVERVASGLELAMATGKPVICGDLSDVAQARAATMSVKEIVRSRE